MADSGVNVPVRALGLWVAKIKKKPLPHVYVAHATVAKAQ
jgi:hypothetical protein